MKKLLAMLLALVMALGVTTMAWATAGSEEGGTTPEAFDLSAAIEAASDNDTITLTGNATIEGNGMTIDKAITIDLNKNALKIKNTNQEGYGPALTLSKAVTIKNGTLGIERAKIQTTACVLVTAGATFENVIFTVNDNIESGDKGGDCLIKVQAGDLAMTGCTVSNLKFRGIVAGTTNTSVSGNISLTDCHFTGIKSQTRGGALYYNGNGDVTIRSSEFNENEAISGGGIQIDSAKVVTIIGTDFMKNKTTQYYGAAMIIQKATSVAITGGTISGNESHSYGTVYIGRESSSADANDIDFVTITGTTISGNKQTDGALKIQGTKKCELNGVTVSENTSSKAGAVIVSTYNEFLMDAASKITGNTATSDAGGLHLTGDVANSTATVKGEISNNTTGGGGGGLYAHMTNASAICTIDGAKITGNTAGFGGGVLANASETAAGKVIFISGEISGNTATNAATAENSTNKKVGGGGVAISRGIFEMTGGTISNNTASTGSAIAGGGYNCENNGHKMSITGGVVNGNVELYTEEGYMTGSVTGGAFSAAPTAYVPDGKAVATVNGTYYVGAAIDDAVKGMSPGDKLTVVKGTVKIGSSEYTAGGNATYTAPARYYYNSTTTTTKDDTKSSPKTFDAGVGVYALTAVLSVTGMAYVGKKKF